MFTFNNATFTLTSIGIQSIKIQENIALSAATITIHGTGFAGVDIFACAFYLFIFSEEDEHTLDIKYIF